MTGKVKLLCFAGSARQGSFNAKLAAVAAAATPGATLISLRDYPMPLYDGDLQARDGIPEAAKALSAQFAAHQAIFIAGPEYNASITPLLKNSLDWVSRHRGEGEEPLAVFKNRVFAIGAASPGGNGGIRTLMALRTVLELGLGALVIPEQIAVPNAAQAFDEAGKLKDERLSALLDRTLSRLMAAAERLSA